VPPFLFGPHRDYNTTTTTATTTLSNSTAAGNNNMVGFLDLPRELRDTIYDALLLSTSPLPTPPISKFLSYDPATPTRYKKTYEPASALRGEFGCAYALGDVPPTCGSVLAVSRQVRAEMGAARARLERKGRVAVRMDCIAEDESFHYFSWVGVPLVETRATGAAGRWTSVLPRWMDAGVARWLAPHVGGSSGGVRAACTSTTRIARLCIDVRIVGDRAHKWNPFSRPADRTAWAVCAALKRFFERGPYLAAEHAHALSHSITVDELVLNVVAPPPTVKLLDEDFPADGVGEGTVHPRTVARELVGVWGKIWAGDDMKGALYGGLLERIGWVRVCEGGETYRVRELRGVLERGQKERKRIAERIGW
jgi:hypothetical protein